MRRIFYGVFVILGAGACAAPRAAGAPLAPLGRSWLSPRWDFYQEWWTRLLRVRVTRAR